MFYLQLTAKKKLNYKEWIQYLLVLYDIKCDKQVVSISLVI